MQVPALARCVPLAVRRQIQAEEREREEAARQAVQRRLDEAERDRRAEERWRAAEFKRVAASVTAWLYFEARCRAMAARFRHLDKDVYASGAYVAFQAEWPDPASPGLVAAAVGRAGGRRRAVASLLLG